MSPPLLLFPLTPLATLIVGALGAAVALISIRRQQEIARKRATLDLLSKREWDADFTAALSKCNRQRDSRAGLAPWADAEQPASPQFTAVRNILNDYELTALGISEGILGEAFHRRWHRSQFLEDRNAARGFVGSLREQAKAPRLYQRMACLAARWEEPAVEPREGLFRRRGPRGN